MSGGETLNNLSYLVNIVVGMIMFIVGVIGSIFIGFIFLTQRAFRQNPCIHYLLAGTVSNFIMLANVLLPRILNDGFGIPMYNANEIFCRERLYMSGVASLCAIYFPCWAAFDQYVSSSRNPSVRHRWSSVKFARKAIIATIMVSTIISIPNWIYNGIVQGICIGTNVQFNQYNAYFLVPLFYGVIPLILISFLTLFMVRNIRSVVVSNMSNYIARQIRRMLIPQLIVIAVAGIPFSVQTAYATSTAAVPKDTLQRAIENLIFHIVRLLFYCNYIFSFYIYVLMSNEVRKSLRRLLFTFICRQKRPTRIQTMTMAPPGQSVTAYT